MLKALPRYTLIIFIVVLLASLFSFKKLDSNFSGWVGLFLGATSLILALSLSYTQAKESRALIESINDLKTSVEELSRNQESSYQSQNERLDNIEKELKVYQKKLTSTNLLSILINRKKQKDYE